jgi:hypothetical protein
MQSFGELRYESHPELQAMADALTDDRRNP